MVRQRDIESRARPHTGSLAQRAFGPEQFEGELGDLLLVGGLDELRTPRPPPAPGPTPAAGWSAARCRRARAPRRRGLRCGPGGPRPRRAPARSAPRVPCRRSTGWPCARVRCRGCCGRPASPRRPGRPRRRAEAAPAIRIMCIIYWLSYVLRVIRIATDGPMASSKSVCATANSRKENASWPVSRVLSGRKGLPVAPPRRPFIWDAHCWAPQATNPGGGPEDGPGATLSRAPGHPYLVLLPVGFAVPRPSPAARCALTAPFHPYLPANRRRFAFCGTFPGVAPGGR